MIPVTPTMPVTPAAPSTTLLEPSFADLIAAIEQAPELSEQRRRHWVCSLRQVAKWMDRPATVIPARWPSVRISVAHLHHARVGVTAKTLANHKSNVRAALRWLGNEHNVPQQDRINVGAIGTVASPCSRPAGPLAVRDRANRGGVRPRLGPAGRREEARERALRGQNRQAVRRRDGLRRLPRAAREQGRRCRRDQHSRPLARHRRSTPRGREGHLPPEAAVADDRRRPRRERHRPSPGPHLPDRQPAALRCPVPHRLRTGAQRPHRQAAHSSRSACRSIPSGGRTEEMARSQALELRRVARLHSGGLLHRRPRPSAQQHPTAPAGCAASSSARG